MSEHNPSTTPDYAAAIRVGIERAINADESYARTCVVLRDLRDAIERVTDTAVTVATSFNVGRIHVRLCRRDGARGDMDLFQIAYGDEGLPLNVETPTGDETIETVTALQECFVRVLKSPLTGDLIRTMMAATSK